MMPKKKVRYKMACVRFFARGWPVPYPIKFKLGGLCGTNGKLKTSHHSLDNGLRC
jgi:hypothetical protein